MHGLIKNTIIGALFHESLRKEEKEMIAAKKNLILVQKSHAVTIDFKITAIEVFHS